jgi:hypothetical protein
MGVGQFDTKVAIVVRDDLATPRMPSPRPATAP